MNQAREWRSTAECVEALLQEKIVEKPVAVVNSMERGQVSFLDKQEPMMMEQTSEQDLMQTIRNDWIYAMSKDGWDLQERMAYFWHLHFPCVCNSAAATQSYLGTLRKHALGNYRQLVHEIAREPAMIRFLNNQQNRKERPNENFARELMEIFTLGEGQYQESDVKAAARAFTGWSSTRDDAFRFRPGIHDYGVKTFRGQSGPWDGDDIIRIILDDPAAHRHLADRLYRHFVPPVAHPKRVEQIAKVIEQSDYDMHVTMEYIFTRDYFYSPENRGVQIKSPVELLAHLIKLFSLRFHDDEALTFLQRTLGQVLFDPPNVAGWPGGRSWIDNATLMLRLNLAPFIVKQEGFDHAVVTSLKADSPGRIIQQLAVDLDLDALKQLFGGVLNDNLQAAVTGALLATSTDLQVYRSRETKAYDFLDLLILRITALPEFQLC